MVQYLVGEFIKRAKEVTEFAKLDKVRNSLPDFIEYTQVDEMGQPLKLGQHHREWLEHIWDVVRGIVEPEKNHPPPEKTDILLFGPREHGKTTIMVACLQFFFGKNPRLRIKYVSKNDDVAIDVVGQVKKNITNNTRLHEVFPNLKKDPDGTWSGSALDFLKVDDDGKWYEADLGIKDANLQAYGVTSPATGGRADLIIFDDIIGGREAILEPGRLEKITKVFYMDWMNVGGKRHIVIGTPWTPQDILANLSQSDDWLKWRKPAINKNGEALWPEERPIEWLMKRKRKVGPLVFALQFMLEGIKPKDEWWTETIIDNCKDKKTRFGQVPADFEIDGILIGVDPAGASKTGSFNCVFAILYDKQKRKCPYRIFRKRCQPQAVAEAVVDMIVEIDATLTRAVDIITVENNATQEAFVDLINLVCELRGIKLKINIVSAFTSSKKWGLEFGLPRMAAEFEARKWIIPYAGEKHYKDHGNGDEWKDPLHECDVCSWIDEMLMFGEAEHTTDMIMSAWLASSAIDKPSIGNLPVGGSTRRASVTNINW